MAKVKTMKLPIEWEEVEKGHLVGLISENGPALTTLESEIMDMPIDIPNLKSKDCTVLVEIKFPESNFSEDRKNELFDSVKEMYEAWKVELTKEAIVIHPDLTPTDSY